MIVLGHRGASGVCPENTLPAFLKAAEQGADGVELDVRLSRDGRIVVVHDVDGLRLAGVDRRVSDCTWSELSAWDVGSWRDPSFGEARIPLLSDVLSSIPAGLRVWVEMKGDFNSGRSRLVSLLRSLGPERAAVLTFDPHDAAQWRLACPEIPVLLNIDPAESGLGPEPTAENASRHGMSGLSIRWSPEWAMEWVTAAKRQGLITAVWTVNDTDVARQARDCGADVLMTDWPGEIVEALANG